MSETNEDRNQQAASGAAENQAGRPEPAEHVGDGIQPQVSEAKKRANRENSKHSTGPRTNEGKARTRLNALKHGFYAHDVVIPCGDGKESQEEFDELVEGLLRAWMPQNAMQEQLVVDIGQSTWRQRRGARAEVGEIRRRTDSYYARQALDFLDEHGFMDSGYWSSEEAETDQRNRKKSAFWSRKEVKDSLRDITLRIDSKLLLLKEVCSVIEENGCLGERLQRTLDSTYGKDHILSTRCHEVSQLMLRQQANEASSSDTERSSTQATDWELVNQQKKVLLANIDVEIKTLEEFRTRIEEAETREHQADLLAYNLPPREFVETLNRYDTPLERKKQNAIKLLLILQGKKK